MNTPVRIISQDWGIIKVHKVMRDNIMVNIFEDLDDAESWIKRRCNVKSYVWHKLDSTQEKIDL